MADEKQADKKKSPVLPTCYGVSVSELTLKNFNARKLAAACENCGNAKKERKSLSEPRFNQAFPVSGCCAVLDCPINKVPKDKRQ